MDNNLKMGTGSSLLVRYGMSSGGEGKESTRGKAVGAKHPFAPINPFVAGTGVLQNASRNEKRRDASPTAEAALRGESHNTGLLKVAAGASSAELRDPRMGGEKVISLTPLDPVAANLRFYVDRTGMAKGKALVRFTSPPEQNCSFDYVITGIQRYGV